MLGCAIVGCGMIARFHARALAEVAGARLVALVSRNPANARAVPFVRRREDAESRMRNEAAEAIAAAGARWSGGPPCPAT